MHIAKQLRNKLGSETASFFSELFDDGEVVFGLLPKIWGEEFVSFDQSFVGGSEGVLSGVGHTFSGSVAIVDTCHLKNLLWSRGGNETGTSWGWDESNSDGTALAGDFHWDGVWLSDFVTPVALSDWDEVELGINDGTLNGSLDFFVDFASNTDVAVVVTNQNNAFESGSLTGLGLLLDRLDLHDFFLELSFKEGVDDLGFFIGDFSCLEVNAIITFNWDGESVDFLNGFDDTSLDQSAELGDWVPFFNLWATLSWASLTASGSTKTLKWKLKFREPQLSISYLFFVCRHQRRQHLRVVLGFQHPSFLL